MKKITFVFFLIFLANHIGAQSHVACSIKMYDDTARSLVNHNKYKISYVINDTDLVTRNYAKSYFEVKFPTSTWKPVIARINKANIDPSGISTCAGDGYLNLLPLFVENDTLVNLLLANPVKVHIRYHLKAKINRGQYGDIYSNIDSLVLPVPQSDDIQAISYIRSSIISATDLIAMPGSGGQDEFNQYKFISDNFPNSKIADMTKLIVFRDETLQQCQPIDSGYIVPPSVKTLVINTCNDFMNSQSELIRKEASAFLEFINTQQ